jgi:hypothetical protein
VVLPRQADAEDFLGLPADCPKEVLLRWVSKRASLRSGSDEWMMLRAVNTLTQEQAVALLKGIAAVPAGKGDSADFVRVALMERLAALDPTVFDALGERENSHALVSTEAAARLKETGADAAIRFAETQASAGYFEEAARGVWSAVA